MQIVGLGDLFVFLTDDCCDAAGYWNVVLVFDDAILYMLLIDAAYIGFFHSSLARVFDLLNELMLGPIAHL